MVLFLETVTNLIGDILDRDIRWNAHTYPQAQLSSRMSTAVKTRFKVESVTNCHENPGNLPNTSRLTLLISRTITIIITVQPPCAYIIAPSRKKSQSWCFAVHHFHGSAANERSMLMKTIRNPLTMIANLARNAFWTKSTRSTDDDQLLPYCRCAPCLRWFHSWWSKSHPEIRQPRTVKWDWLRLRKDLLS